MNSEQKKSVVKVNFSQTFSFRKNWLFLAKKNFKNKKIIATNDDYLEVGLGKNMMSSIKGWLTVFDLYNDTEHLKEITYQIKDNFGNDKITKLYLHFKMTNVDKATFWYFIFCVYNGTLKKDLVVNSFKLYLSELSNKNYSLKSLETEYSVFKKHFCGNNTDLILNESFFKGLDLIVEKNGLLVKNVWNLSLLNNKYFDLINFFIKEELGNEFTQEQLINSKILNKINFDEDNISEILYELETRKYINVIRDSKINIITLLKNIDITESNLLERIQDEIF